MISLSRSVRTRIVTDQFRIGQFLRGRAQRVGAEPLCHPVEDILPDAGVTQPDTGKIDLVPLYRRDRFCQRPA